MSRNSHSIATIFVEKIGSFCQLKIIELDQAFLNVIKGMEEEFLVAFDQAQHIISSMKGYVNHQLSQCLETEGRYLLLVNWETLEDHTKGFRNSPEYQEWKALLHHFYDPFPVVEHYQPLLPSTKK